jgi:NADPH:quinone reductase-like Zn-dependent oxidoreductase
MAGGSLAAALQAVFLGPLISMIGSKKLGLVMVRPNQQDLAAIKDLLEAGGLIPVVDRAYPLGEVAEALRYLEEGHATGKLVITV